MEQNLKASMILAFFYVLNIHTIEFEQQSVNVITFPQSFVTVSVSIIPTFVK